MTAMQLPGCVLRPIVYTPTFHKHAMKANGGVQIHVTHSDEFRPYRTRVAFLKAAHDQAPEQFAWRVKAYEFVDQIPAIALLAGSAALREGIEAGASIDDLTARWPRDEGAWLEEREPYLLYECRSRSSAAASIRCTRRISWSRCTCSRRRTSTSCGSCRPTRTRSARSSRATILASRCASWPLRRSGRARACRVLGCLSRRVLAGASLRSARGRGRDPLFSLCLDRLVLAYARRHRSRQ